MRDAAGVLGELGVAPEDQADLLAAWPSPEVWELAERAAQDIARTFGEREAEIDLTVPAEVTDPDTRKFWNAYLALALLPKTREYYRERGIPDEIARPTLCALGVNLARHRRIYGRSGVDGDGWVILVFRGLIFHIGRLVFERAYVGNRIADVVDTVRANDDALGVHIPPALFHGPLDPAACDKAFDAAVEFFAEHFPEDSPSIAHCESWMIDPTLAEYLPETSNIVAFQRRFTEIPGAEPYDEGIIGWVFEAEDPAQRAELSPKTTLQRSILEHLRSGRHWRMALGWLSLDFDGNRSAPGLRG